MWRYIECVMSCMRKNHGVVESCKRTMPLTNINSDWISNASSGLCINLFIYNLLHFQNGITKPKRHE